MHHNCDPLTMEKPVVYDDCITMGKMKVSDDEKGVIEV